jgi:hypothetical protein
MKGKLMSDKTHNVTSLPDGASRATDEGETEATVAVSRVKNVLQKQKKVLIGGGAGMATAVTVIAIVRKNADEETELDDTVDTDN